MAEPTYTVKITFHGAYNLPASDMNTLSCDPYIHATLVVPTWKPHDNNDDGQNPPLTFRTPTIRRSRNAEWCPPEAGGHTDACKEGAGAASSGGDAPCVAAGVWIVGGVPASGFALTMRVRDEDPGNRDDRLGRARASFPDNAGGGPGRLGDGWAEGRTRYAIKKRHASPRAYLQTYVAAALPSVRLNKHGHVEVSVCVVGRTEGEEARGRVFTVGPSKWTQHFSPLIGAFTPARAAHPAPPTDKGKDRDAERATGKGAPFDRRADNTEGGLRSSVFIANKLQLAGPVPRALRNEFVGYRPFINWMFKSQGVRGMLLNRALKKQYRTIYSYDKNTRYGVVTDGGGDDHEDEQRGDEGGPKADQEPAGDGPAKKEGGASSAHSRALALQFLRMTSFGTGGRMFTYAITLDGEWRWTETGEEFAVDLLSKHTMHADVQRVIAWSGEFFVRRVVDAPGGGFASGAAVEDGTIAQDGNGEDKADGGEAEDEGDAAIADDADADDEEPVEDPARYELVIDNDSGTYRPPKDKLPVLRAWLADARRLGALGRVTCVDGFDPALKREKKARAATRKRGKGVQEGDAEKGKEGNAGAKKTGAVARVKQAADGVETKVMEAVGKDESHAKGKGGAGGRMALPRSGSSVSSIGSGILGEGRRGSVSSDEVKGALAKAEKDAAGQGGDGPSQEARAADKGGDGDAAKE